MPLVGPRSRLAFPALALAAGGFVAYQRHALPNSPLPPALSKRSNHDSGRVRTVLVVGGGIVGLLTAYKLDQQGYRVRLFEGKERVASAASSTFGNACFVSQHGYMDFTQPKYLRRALTQALAPLWQDGTEHERHQTNAFFDWRGGLLTDPYFLRFAATLVAAAVLDSGRRVRWSGWADDVNAAARAALWRVADEEPGLADASRLRDDGILYAHLSPPQVPEVASGGANPGNDVFALTPDACVEREPFLVTYQEGEGVGGGSGELRLRGGLSEVGTSGNSRIFCEKLAERLQQRSCRAADDRVEIRHNAKVASLEVTDDNGLPTVSGVVLESGERVVGFDAVVVCAGAHTAKLMQTVGIYLPIHPMQGYSITVPITDASKVPQSTTVLEPYGLYLARPSDRTIRATCYGEFRSMADLSAGKATPALVGRLQELVRHAFPHFDAATGGEAGGDADTDAGGVWVGARPQTPDSLPIVGECGAVGGLYVNAGHSSYGWKLAAHSADILVEALRGERSRFGELYSYRRFDWW